MSTIRTRVRKPNENFALNQQEDFKRIEMDFAKLARGMQVAKDSVLQLDKFRRRMSTQLADMDKLHKAMEFKDFQYMREVSQYFFDTSGIYARLCRYLAFILTYDWMVTPYVISDNVKADKVLNDFSKVLLYLDNMKIKSTFSQVSLEIVKSGCYYGYLRENGTTSTLQQLPTMYCRSRYKLNGLDAVEFDVRYFDQQLRDTEERLMVLQTFPKEIVKAYIDWKEGRLMPDRFDAGAWTLCDPNFAIKFCINNNDMPIFLSAIPEVINLEQMEGLEKQKAEQELLKIVIQKMPLDKNGELIFDVEEARDMHNNAVQMLGKAVGVDVLTTFADTQVASMVDRSSTGSTKDPMARVERAVFNEAGISQMLFATDGNLALDKSVINDEAIMFSLLSQYENWLNIRLNALFNTNPKKLYFKVSMPHLTIYNFKDMAKLFKDQAMLGFSKLLPAIALGQSQSSLLATIQFENEFLKLSEIMIPPQMSSTMSNKGGDPSKNPPKNADPTTQNEGAGRPEKEDSQKSEKTIQNKESAN